MKRVRVKLLFLSLIMFFFCLVSNVISNSVKTHKTTINKVDVLKAENLQKVKLKVSKSYGKIPLYFIKNKGQVNEKVLYYAKTRRYTLWIIKEGLVFDLIVKEGKDNSKGISEREGKRKIKGRDVSKLIFKNYNNNLKVIPVDMVKHRVNYLKGNDKTKWIKNIETSKGILFKSIYPNIDLKVYGIEKEIEYDWIVKKGGKAEDIAFEYKNVEGTKIDKDGNIVIEMKFTKLKHKKPVSYQIDERGNRKYVESEFIKSGKNIYKLKVKKYDKSRDLIIDPEVLVYSTYLGGSNVDAGYGIAVDSSGCAYVSGWTSSNDFPVQYPFQGTFGGGEDAFVTKLTLLQWRVTASVSGGHGSVSPASQIVNNEENATINITPDTGYEIESITDNGISQSISNPYVINNVREDHNVVVRFKVLFILNLSVERKIESAWIIKRGYGKLNISVLNPSGMDYGLIIQRSRNGGEFQDIKSIGSSEVSGGAYLYYDKYLEKGSNYTYRVIAKDSSGNMITISNSINL